MPTATTLPLLPRRSYGVELETSGGRHTAMADHPGFGQKCDCSISGLEYVSPILRGRAGLRKIRAFMRGQRLPVNRECGFHLHIDMRDDSDMDNPTRFLVAAAYLAVEDQWFAKVSQSRRSNHYCYRWESRFLHDFMEAARYRDSFYDMARMQDRYNWMNIRAFVDHGSFENRLHQGTWNFTKVKNWIALNLRFVKAASRIRVNGSISEFKDKAAACLMWAESGATRVPLRQIAA